MKNERRNGESASPSSNQLLFCALWNDLVSADSSPSFGKCIWVTPSCCWSSYRMQSELHLLHTPQEYQFICVQHWR